MRRKPGFTLLEVLTVIAIIAILCSLLLPALSGAMRRGREATCISQLAHIGRGVLSFREDYQVYPPAGSPMTTLSLSKKTPEVFTCPMDPGRPQKHDTYSDYYNYYGYAPGNMQPVPLKTAAEAKGVYEPRNGDDRNFWHKDPDDPAAAGYPDADFPGLCNQDAPKQTIVTICPHHTSNRGRYAVLRLDGSADFVVPTDGDFWAMSTPIR